MQRALFSNEAGQGSAPIAHSAAKTDEPVREGIVAGLEPFIDTLCVCTLTGLVILLSGAWNRGPALAPEGAMLIEPVVANGGPVLTADAALCLRQQCRHLPRGHGGTEAGQRDRA
jgi:AGCS family alanine or glycine:cation symporter